MLFVSVSSRRMLISVAGGASGCLIAGRLAAADPSLKILVRVLTYFYVLMIEPSWWTDFGSWRAYP